MTFKLYSRFQNIYLFHGKGGSPLGSVAGLQNILESKHTGVNFSRPLLPHSDTDVTAQDSLAWLEKNFVPFIKPNSLIIGVSLGGLLAAKLQENHPELDFSVFTLVTPTSYEEVSLKKKLPNRVSLYSTTADETIRGLCANWPDYSDLAFDVPWLVHDVDIAKHTICFLISCYLGGLNMEYEVENLFLEFQEPAAEGPYY